MGSRTQFVVLVSVFCLFIASGMPVQAQDSSDFVEVTVDRTTAYIGEPILYTWRWYLAMAVVEGTEADSRVVRPAFDTFGQEELEVSTESTIRNGATYQIIKQEIVLYPRREGVYSIEPLRVLVPETPFSPARTLESQPLTLTIKPLPADAPPTFVNAIGQFEMQATLNQQVAQTGEPLTLTMTITGSGNGPLIYTPQLALGDEWRVYPAQSRTRRDGPLLGERVFSWSVIPLQPGDLTIPSQSWSFLNPQTGQYETRATTPFTVSVTGKAIAAPQMPTAAAEPTLYPLSYGLRLTRPGETPQGPIVIDTHGSRTFYPRSGITSDGLLLAAVPVLLAAAAWMISSFWPTQTQPKAKAVKQKRKSVFEQRMKQLVEKSPHQVAIGIHELLRDVLSQKFGVAVPVDHIEDFIPRLPAEVQSDWQACFDLANTARYAPFTAEDATRLIEDTQRTLERTEALWRAR